MRRLAIMFVAFGLVACGSSEQRPDAGSVNPDAGSAVTDAGSESADAGSTTPDAGAGFQFSNPQFNANGCLTQDSVSAFCGFKSQGEVCAFAKHCAVNADESQCKINCEMGASFSKCYKQPDIDCLVHALNANDCAAFRACGWVL